MHISPPKKIKLDHGCASVIVLFSPPQHPAPSKQLSCQKNTEFTLPFEYLRVFSPSAEVRGHGKGQEVLQLNKQNVKVTDITMQGNYAVRITFDDGHDSGLYTWAYLHELGTHMAQYWEMYLEKVTAAKCNTQPIKWIP